MKPILLAASAVAVFAAVSSSPPARAGDGHDHGEAAHAAAGPAAPRFTAVSPTFELVGVLDGRHVTLYLDRADDNAPVTGAQIELEIAGARLKADRHDDVYEAVLDAAPRPGVLPVAATVAAGGAVVRLVGELDLHDAAHADEDDHPAPAWQSLAGWAAAAAAALAAAALVGRRVAAARRRRAGAAA